MLKDILISARDSLTEENWNQGSYFSVKDDHLCMCAHGAVQKLVNPKVKRIIDSTHLKTTSELNYNIDAIAASRSATVAEAAANAADEAAMPAADIGARGASLRRLIPINALLLRRLRASTNEVSLSAAQSGAGLEQNIMLACQQVWNNRPSWVKEADPIYGNVNAHFLLGMVGLTPNFNDADSTHLSDIKKKFDQAIDLAEILGL